MKTNSIITASLLLAIAGMSAGCSSDKKKSMPEQSDLNKETNRAVEASMDAHDAYYTVVEFDKNSEALNESNKKSLRTFIENAQKEGKEIDDIKIMAWSDKEYPVQGATVDKKDVKMAEERTESIEKYLKRDLAADGNYASYNMAKRPNKLNEFFKGNDYKTKKTFEESGAAPTDASTDLAMFMNNKASKALIMVDYE